jgi:hypothetical protein
VKVTILVPPQHPEVASSHRFEAVKEANEVDWKQYVKR